MGNEWKDNTPRWVKRGRIGPGAAAPRIAKRKERAKMRKDYRKASGDGCVVLLAGLVVLGSVVGSAAHYFLF